jgi:hypothetical protein
VRPVRAFLLGAVAVALLAYVTAATVAMAAQAAGRSLEVALGPVVLVAVSRDGATTVTTFGGGILLLAVAGGLANAAAAGLLRRRAGPDMDRVD